MKRLFLCLLLIIGFSAHAAEPDEVLADPTLEERARAIDEQLRCVVCQSQSIADSNAPLAKDLRVIVRERIAAGDTDAQAIQYVVDRYGDYVLMKPPVQGNTLVLWAFPVVSLMIGGVIAVSYLRAQTKKKGKTNAALSDEDEAALQKIIEERSE